MAPTVLSEDALNRYRIAHSDRELRPLLRRLHRFSHLTNDAQDNEENALEQERELIHLDVLKWKISIERLMGSVDNLQRQKAEYERQTQQTVETTAQLKATLEEEKVLLEKRRVERGRMIKCDEVAKKISARGKTKQELDEQIALLRTSLAEHQSSHQVYLQTVQTRIDLFAQITELVKTSRDTKLPFDPNAPVSLPTAASGFNTTTNNGVETNNEESTPSTSLTSTEVAEAPAPGAGSSRLSSMALPFQPSRPSPGVNSSNSNKSRASTPPSSSLPSRPAPRQVSSSTARVGGVGMGGTHGLPSRPSGLKASTTALEEGEVEGEDGEVRERGTKRSASAVGGGVSLGDGERASRSTRSRK